MIKLFGSFRKDGNGEEETVRDELSAIGKAVDLYLRQQEDAAVFMML